MQVEAEFFGFYFFYFYRFRMKRLVLLLFLLPTVAGIIGKPAKPGLMVMTEPDGTTVSVRLAGDERGHLYLDESGRPLVREHGFFYYAEIDDKGKVKATSVRLSNKAEGCEIKSLEPEKMEMILSNMRRDAAKFRYAARNFATRGDKPDEPATGLITGFDYPKEGEPKSVVILVEFADKEFVLDNPLDYFYRMLNEEGFSDYGGTGSARDYFVDNSSGKFRPRFDVYGPVKLKYETAYYGGNDSSGNDQRPEEMVIEACYSLDDEVDFSQYDTDGDGYIDNIYIYYAGEGEASGGDDDTVWPHSWYVPDGEDGEWIVDGVSLGHYACSNEWETGRPDGVGTFIHEFSHILGLPDLYATDYSDAFTPGRWSVLDVGSYNNQACTPPNYSCFERYSLGWGNPIELNRPVYATLPAIDENIFGVIRTRKKNDYFLVENRQQNGWDTYLPGHGMLIWHIDFSQREWDENSVNNDREHQRVDIVEADGIQTSRTLAGDTFPGTKRVTSFTSTTDPAMLAWNGDDPDTPIENINETAGLITFTVKGGGPDWREDVSDSGIAATPSDKGPEITIEPAGVTVKGLKRGCRIEAFDASGTKVAVAIADDCGEAWLPISGRGFYIIRSCGMGTMKVVK